MVLEATKNFSTLTLDDLEGELVTYEMSINQQKTEIIDEVLQAKVTQPNRKEEISNLAKTNQRGQNFRDRGQENRGNFRGHGIGDFSYQQRNNNNFSKEQQSNQNFQRHDKSTVQCHNCGKCGHYERDCWFNKFETTEAHAKLAENYGDKQETLLFCILGIEENKGIEWFIESNCSNHMSENKKLFIDLDESFRATIRLGDLENIFLINEMYLNQQTDKVLQRKDNQSKQKEESLDLTKINEEDERKDDQSKEKVASSNLTYEEDQNLKIVEKRSEVKDNFYCGINILDCKKTPTMVNLISQ
ncbi:uncharacterized protein LOC129872549 [Solanum dulcamara]|uniref:uncharacterized protein LOC129872549 n=1 Tax=Solanum dulcamara TaxID=45834 RepID=UPI00248623D9|nr:uncharacterized protein LOC129872549 [Solanum dulcamara]